MPTITRQVVTGPEGDPRLAARPPEPALRPHARLPLAFPPGFGAHLLSVPTPRRTWRFRTEVDTGAEKELAGPRGGGRGGLARRAARLRAEGSAGDSAGEQLPPRGRAAGF